MVVRCCRTLAATFSIGRASARAGLIGLALLALSACAGEMERTAAAAADLSPAASLYVAIPADGGFAGYVDPGSGARLAAVIVDTFAAYLRRVDAGEEAETPAAALASARDGGYTYLAIAKILRWEDRASGWSGMADAVEVRLALIEADSGHPADIAVLVGDDGPTVDTSRDETAADQPEDLLAGPLAIYADRVLAAAAGDAEHAAR